MSAKFLNSLLLTISISFTAPMLLMSAVWVSTWLFTCLPGLGSLGEIAIDLLRQFLIVFGNGSPWQGMLVISLVCGFVGALFDTYAFYSFQTQRGN
jgi:hypothetical protein